MGIRSAVVRFGANLLFVLSASGSYYILLRKIYGCLPSAPVSL